MEWRERRGGRVSEGQREERFMNVLTLYAFTFNREHKTLSKLSYGEEISFWVR